MGVGGFSLFGRFSSFPRAPWECSQGALRLESRSASGVYGTQRVLYCIPTRRVGTSEPNFDVQTVYLIFIVYLHNIRL